MNQNLFVPRASFCLSNCVCYSFVPLVTPVCFIQFASIELASSQPRNSSWLLSRQCSSILQPPAIRIACPLVTCFSGFNSSSCVSLSAFRVLLSVAYSYIWERWVDAIPLNARWSCGCTVPVFVFMLMQSPTCPLASPTLCVFRTDSWRCLDLFHTEAQH